LAVAAAAVFAVTLFWWNGPAGASRVPPPAVPARALTLIEQRELADGSVVKLNRGAFLSERFSLTERRVRLDRGEAHFMVEPDPGRPFVVEAAGVAVRAVGTAFNVRIDSAAVEVVVTEGKVAVGTDDGGRTTEDGRPAFALQPPTSELRPPPDGVWPLSSGTLISAGERTVVSLVPNAPAPEVTTLSSAEIEARLAWQPRLLDFTNAPLPEIVAEFNRGNPVRLTLGDASLHALRLSATFRSDNVEGFVRLMVSDFGMRAERRGEAEILLSRVK
jgi:transmembrane sensor